MLRRFSASLLIATFALALTLAGCTGSSETVSVTQRPEPIPSTETPADTTDEPVIAMPSAYDTVQAQRFDQGKMWTFEDPPVEYFSTTYDFDPAQEWFEQARLGALRFGESCSASFVSPNGLIMTNHHCGRESITKVSKSGENLLDEGFWAESLEQERKVPELHVEQLVEIEDVTDRVYGRDDRRRSNDATAQGRQQRANQLEEQLTQEAKKRDAQLTVDVVALYNGSQYSAYTYRRYENVRLVMAPELKLGFYGGTDDNFTYPRFALDVAFFRAYDDEGEPLETPNYFEWNTSGAQEGDAVFAIGNPGSTSRLNTLGQLEFERDVALPRQLDYLRHRADLIDTYIQQHPDSTEAYDLRNTYFSMDNSIKGMGGQLRGLRDPYLIARRAAAEKALQDTITSTDSLRQQYGDIVTRIQQLQQSKRVTARRASAFTYFTSSQIGSRILTRAIYGYYHNQLQRRGAPQDQLQEIRDEALTIEDWPADLERQFIATRLHEIREGLGASDPTVQRLMRDRTPEEIADQLVQNSALIDSTRFADLLSDGYLNSDDASVPVIEALAPIFFTINQQRQDYNATEQNLNARLARARRTVRETQVPPDATFTLRIADGVVRGYEYNGTRAPAFTNFYGLYDHHFSYQQDAWTLPDTWLDPPAAFDFGTPLNMVTTNDIAGGSSGSPLVNKNLEIVGLVFDSNIEALPNKYLYTNRVARAISVDARAILEALSDFYEADRIAEELRTGTLYPTEEEAEAQTTSARGMRQ